MLLEDLLLAIAIGTIGLVLGLPTVRFLKAALQRRKDPLAEAHERLRLAKLEAEVARVNREAERIYETLYDDTLKHHAAAPARVAAKEACSEEREEEEGQTLERPLEKGKHHGHG